MTLSDALGRVLRGLRQTGKLKLRDVSERAKISIGFLSQVELGRNYPSFEVLGRLVAVYGIGLAQFFALVESEMKK